MLLLFSLSTRIPKGDSLNWLMRLYLLGTKSKLENTTWWYDQTGEGLRLRRLWRVKREAAASPRKGFSLSFCFALGWLKPPCLKWFRVRGSRHSQDFTTENLYCTLVIHEAYRWNNEVLLCLHGWALLFLSLMKSPALRLWNLKLLGNLWKS